MSSKLKFILGFLAVVAGFLLIRIGLIFKGNMVSATANISNAVSSQSQTNPQGNALTRDSDHDGLPDREEIIYGTDPFNPDTDGDGYKDGEEVMTGHNPLDVSDNDKTRPGRFDPLKPNLTTKTVNLTLASFVGDDGSINPSNLTDANASIVANTLNTQAGVLLFVAPIKDSDLKISNDNSPEALANYISAISPILKNYIFNTKILFGMANPDNGILAAIDNYQKADQELRIMTIPSSWKTIHEILINISDELIQSSQFLTRDEINNDPIKSLYALQQLRTTFSSIPDVTTQIMNLAKAQNLHVQNLFGF